MAKRSNPGKLAGKTPATASAAALPASDMSETVDFPDALAYINSLVGQTDGVDWNIRIYKVDTSGRGVKAPQAFLFNVELEDLPAIETVLAREYEGGGTFKIVVRANNQIVRSAMLEIAPRPGYVPPPPSYLARAAAPVAEAQPAGADRMELFFQRMADMQERSAQQTRDLIAAMSKQQPAAPTLAEQLSMFKQFQSMLPNGAQENSMDLFQKGMDFASKMYDARGDSGGGTSWLDIVKEAIGSPVAKDMLAAMVAAGANAAPPGTALNALAAPPALITPENPQAAQAVDTLLRQAVAGVDPKFVAGQLANTVPEAFMQELEAQPDVVAYLVQRFPAARQHIPWLTTLVAELWEVDEGEPHNQSPALDHNARPDSPPLPQV